MSTPLRERPDAPLGTLIFRAGLLPAETIESALEEGVKTGKRLGEILTERGLLKEADLARLLAGQKGLDFVTLREQIVDPAAACLFTEDQARLFRALPFAFEEGAPLVAIADPTDEVLTRNIREALGRDDARFVVSVRSELNEIVGQVYAEGVAAAAPPAPAPFADTPPAPEAPSFADTTAPGPGSVEPEHVRSEPLHPSPADAPAPQPPAAEFTVPDPIADPPAPEVPSPADTAGGLTPGHVSEGHGELPAQPAPNGYQENGAVAPDVVPAPQAQPVAPEPPPVAAEAAASPAPAPEPVVAEPHQAKPTFAQPAFAVPAVEEAPQPPAPELPAVQPPTVAAAPEPPPAQEPVTPAVVEVPAAPAAAPAVATPVPSGQVHRLTIRLANGERVEVGAYGDLEAAKASAKALMAEVAAADGGDWPFVNGRFLKPDTIVSVDIS